MRNSFSDVVSFDPASRKQREDGYHSETGIGDGGMYSLARPTGLTDAGANRAVPCYEYTLDRKRGNYEELETVSLRTSRNSSSNAEAGRSSNSTM